MIFIQSPQVNPWHVDYAVPNEQTFRWRKNPYRKVINKVYNMLCLTWKGERFCGPFEEEVNSKE